MYMILHCSKKEEEKMPQFSPEKSHFHCFAKYTWMSLIYHHQLTTDCVKQGITYYHHTIYRPWFASAWHLWSEFKTDVRFYSNSRQCVIVSTACHVLKHHSTLT